MFEAEKVKELNELELIVYEYVLEHLAELPHMTIRQLSDACHVSTSTILRCCNKLGYQGFTELKFAVKQELARDVTFEQFYDATIQVDQFLKKVNQDDYRVVLEPAVQMILDARHIAFSGIGTSGILGAYGSRYFMNLGLNAYSISDPFAPVPPRGLDNTLAIILSVSGETKEMVAQIQDFKRYGAKTMSITNQENSTIARLADHNISYYMPEIIHGREHDINLTTQTPVIALLEILAQQTNRRIEQEEL
ncbi:RpiR family transcriptional regulator [Enterococcus canis]|uniref:RpiR family transcriptional regulator n=1 Tax=Enterococcus canis TaxID=214095 RepID=A0A1L8RJ18_9ENTE|nr:MurR/RpiR family transcriptional regulator [Enterococcus canis]OJG19705.1 RpiR family transcriptional regulator [Enterococcus canis]